MRCYYYLFFFQKLLLANHYFANLTNFTFSGRTEIMNLLSVKVKFYIKGKMTVNEKIEMYPEPFQARVVK